MNEFQKLLFPTANVRGSTVVLHEAFTEAIAHQKLPGAVRRLAGEAAAAAVLAAGALDFDGAVLLQIAGDGPVKLLVAEVKRDLTFRISVRLRDDADPAAVAEDADMKALVNQSGRGRCALILDPKDRAPGQQPYQGVVALEGSTFAEAFEAYFRDSAQLDTKIKLAAGDDAAGGIMLQRMPTEGGKTPENYDPEGWNRIAMFADTVKTEELLTLAAGEVNRRLFWEESPLVTMEKVPAFSCRCSDDAVRSMLKNLGEEELRAIIASEGKIEVTCDFCGQTRTYDDVDVTELFKPVEKAEA